MTSAAVDQDRRGQAAADPGTVMVDRLGVPAPPAGQALAQVLALGLPETARQRLQAAGVERLVDDPAAAAGSDAALLSTRLPRAELEGLVAAVRAAAPVPLVALAHTGGEANAVELVRLGAIGVVAEGNEAAIGAVVRGTAHDTALLESYERQAGDGGEGAESARDEVTGLPGEAALRQALAEAVQAGDVPRVAYVRVLFLEEAARRLAPAAVSLLRRRLASRFGELCRAAGARLHALSLADFALLSDRLTPHAIEALAARLAAVTETYAPSGQRTLAVAMGHAGPEVATEPAALAELAQRALVVAAAAQRSGVVGAESLALGTSSTTELEAARRLLAHVEQHDGHPPGHGTRVARIAVALARDLGADAATRGRARLAAHLHDIGKAGLPPEAMAGTDALDGDLLWSYRSHTVRGADYLRVSAGEEVAQAVRAHHERWDGEGFPDGLAGAAIPELARVIAVADRFDTLRHGLPGREPLPAGGAVAALLAEAGTVLDPDLVRRAVALLPALEQSDRDTP